MTIQQLIETLKQFPPESEVKLCFASLAEGGNVSVPVKQVGATETNVVELWNEDYVC